jgi:histidinol-phosphate aminotransferase
MSAALALAALRAGRPDVAPTIAERTRLAAGLRALGLEPLPSHANFLYVPIENARGTYERLLREGIVVRPFDEAIRITVHRPDADDRLLGALERLRHEAENVGAQRAT